MKTTTLLLLLLALRCAALETNITTIEWISDPAPRLSIASPEQIGFRSDGVVVWRKFPIATNIVMLPIYTNTVATMSITNRDDDLILRLAKDGTLCKVIGHYFERHTHLTLVYVNGTSECRECRTCKAHQWYYYVEGVWR